MRNVFKILVGKTRRKEGEENMEYLSVDGIIL
jgi:hypothetical protein